MHCSYSGMCEIVDYCVEEICGLADVLVTGDDQCDSMPLCNASPPFDTLLTEDNISSSADLGSDWQSCLYQTSLPPIVPSSPISNRLLCDLLASHDSKLKVSLGMETEILGSYSPGKTCSPLPDLKWADREDVWEVMKMKEFVYRRDASMLQRHPRLDARMRSILLDWLVEVCEVYRLHRETYHLTVDFIDRYLSSQINVEKSQLQLIGITCLFIAAKIEEIYPPKIGDFAYVTDGACTEYEITRQELLVLKTTSSDIIICLPDQIVKLYRASIVICLRWDLSPMTANAWLSIYLQLIYLSYNDTSKCVVSGLSNSGSSERGEDKMTGLRYTGHSFVQLAQLMDLCLLDVGNLKFAYSQLAAAVIYNFADTCTALLVSGYRWDDVAECVEWMEPFAQTLRKQNVADAVHMKVFENVKYNDCHNIQTHSVELSTLEAAQYKQKEFNKLKLRSTELHSQPKALNHSTATTPTHSSSLLTPPSSCRKPNILRH